MKLAGVHWLKGVEHLPSPNADERPPDTDIDLLVIHSISLPPGEFGGPDICDLFLNRLDTNRHPYFAGLLGLEVSAHLLIRRDGSATQFVALDRRAWHAGESDFHGRKRCNDFSIGIELEGSDDTDFSAEQYRALCELTGQIQNMYPSIRPDRIVGHSDIAPGRKTDPGPCFDWTEYRRLLSESHG